MTSPPTPTPIPAPAPTDKLFDGAGAAAADVVCAEVGVGVLTDGGEVIVASVVEVADTELGVGESVALTLAGSDANNCSALHDVKPAYDLPM